MEQSPQQLEMAQLRQLSLQQLEELLNCQICYCKVANPSMCPHCSKLYCDNCLRRSLEVKPECPNCRKTLRGEAPRVARFVNEIQSIIKTLIVSKEEEEVCQQHALSLNYYCWDCKEAICCECCMFGGCKGHKILPIDSIYKQKYKEVRELLSQFRVEIFRKEAQLREMEEWLGKVKAVRMKYTQEIKQYELNLKCKAKEFEETRHQKEEEKQQEIAKYLQSIKEVESQIKTTMAEAKASGSYRISEELAQKVSSILGKKSQEVILQHNIIEELVPQYKKCAFTLLNYDEKCNHLGKVYYSECMSLEDQEWRLKAYPSGNEGVEGVYFSVFIELTSKAKVCDNYEFRIELVHPSEPQRNVSKEYHSKFQSGAAWGFNKFCLIEKIREEGFIRSDGALELNYYIRLPLYYDLYKQREKMISNLDGELEEQDEIIKELQRSLGRAQPHHNYSEEDEGSIKNQ